MGRMWWLSYGETGVSFYSGHEHGSTAKEDGVDGHALFVCNGKEKVRMDIRIRL